MQLINPLKNYNSTIIKEYKNKLLFENIRRLKVVALVGCLVNVLILFIIIRTNGFYSITSIDSILRVMWVVASFIYVLAVGHPQNHEQLTKKHRIIFFGATSLSLLFSGIIMSILFVNTGYSFLYIVNCMITGSFLYLSFFEILSVMMPTISYFIFVMLISGRDIPHFQSNAINIFTVTIFTIMIAIMSYRSQISLFDSQNIIHKNNNSLKELAELDGLIQIPNRRKFDQVYSLEWAHACRDKKPLSLIMIDIDYFKNYNDYYGHLTGDDCLKQIATILKTSLPRQTDIVCRYGGEEFIVVLPNTDQHGAMRVAEQIRQNVASACIHHKGSEFNQITLSIGTATLAEFNSYAKEELISAADKAMYAIKQKGRNQIASDMLM